MVQEEKEEIKKEEDDIFIPFEYDDLYEIPDTINLNSNITSLSLKGNMINCFNLNNLPNKLVKLNLSFNNLKKLLQSWLPKTLTELDVSYNELENFEFDETNINILNLYENILESITVNDKITYLNIGSNALKTLPNMSKTNLVCLNFSLNSVSEIPVLNKKLRYLDCSYNCIKNINNLPEGLHELNISDNHLEQFTVPDGLVKLICYENKIHTINNSKFSDDLVELDLSHNLLVLLPPLGRCLENVDLSNNCLLDLDVPNRNSLTYLNISYNNLKDIPVTVSNNDSIIVESVKYNQVISYNCNRIIKPGYNPYLMSVNRKRIVV